MIWSEIEVILKEIVRIKMGWKHFQTGNPTKIEPQISRGLLSIHVLILHFKFQFSKYVKSSTFHVFVN